ncbi:hypothetical protein MBLNU13_g08569t1 [Cladosporium sp. NU13]
MAVIEIKDDVQTPKARRVTNIDRRSCRRVVPMQVLVLGLSRTGTNSLREALEILGYQSTYHGYAAALENPRDCEMWLDALRAKFEGKGPLFGKSEFDQLLGHCQAVTDIPAACFAPELIAAYPEAKVILSNRDIDAWHESVSQNLLTRVYNPWAAIVATMARLCRSNGRWSRPAFTIIFDKFFRHFPTNGKAVYREHYATVRSMAPRENLLEYHITEGWEPLCRFLEKDVPAVAFPSGNDGDATGELIRELVRSEAILACKRSGAVFSAVALLVLGFLFIFYLVRGLA